MNQELEIKVKRLSEDAILPTYGSEDAFCFDLYATADLDIKPGTNGIIDFQIAFEPPAGYGLKLHPRSSIGAKTGLRLANSIGIIDGDYRNSVKAVYTNIGTRVEHVKKGQRMAQMEIVKRIPVRFKEVEELSETKRGLNGFGSTGK